jgi:hypothetical protein
VNRPLTITEERQMLAELREHVRTVDQAEYDSAVSDQLGVAALDQLRAATADARNRIPLLKEFLGLKFEHTTSTESGLAVMLLAGTLRCFAGGHCEHAVAGGHPVYALLAARVVGCRGCLLQFRDRIAAADRRSTDRVGDGR